MPFSLQDQAKEWVAVLSKRSKKALKKISPLKPRKRVRFADNLVSNSPPVKHVPAFDVETIVFGSLPPVMCEKAVQSVPDLSRSSGDVPTRQIFGKLSADLDVQNSAKNKAVNQAPSNFECPQLGLEKKLAARSSARARSGSARLGAAREPRTSRAEPLFSAR